MVDYRLFINNGVDAFNTTGKTLSIEEQPKTGESPASLTIK